MDRIPQYGFLRLSQIIGNKRKESPPIIPVSASTWWAGVQTGRYPKGIKHGGATFWRAKDIDELVTRISNEDSGKVV